MCYVPMDQAIAMVAQVNNAETKQEHRDALMRLKGYKQRCAEICQLWPCRALHYYFASIDDRPTSCGIYMDWQPADTQEE